jgi:hypothetical protein
VEKDKDLKEILREVSSAISKSLSSPETLEKLEQLHQKGYQLYLVMEPKSDSPRKAGDQPIMPIQVMKSDKKSFVKEEGFALSESDKNFLRTLKIKVD